MSRNLFTTMLILPRQFTLAKSSAGLINKSLWARQLSSKTLSPTITLLSNGETKHIQTNPKSPTLDSYSSEGRPLSIMLCWLMAKNNAVNKYAKFYLDQGFDVLTVRISPWQLLWPNHCVPTIQNELLPILQSSDHESKLIHGFSVGGYIFGQLLKYLNADLQKNQALMNSIKGQIWDSVVDVNGVSIGVSKSVFMTNETLQKMLHNYIEFHMKAFYNVATKYYFESHEHFYYKPLKTPALFLNSKVDLISTLDVIQAVQECWKERGITCTTRLWDKTAHVGHMHKYPDEYKQIVSNFLKEIGMKKPEGRVLPSKIRQRDIGDFADLHHVVFYKSS